MEFRYNLKALRKKNKITQEELASIIGVERSSVGKYETGVIPSPDILLKLADYFNVSVDYLLGRDDAPSASGSFSDIPNVRQIRKKKIPVLGEIACGEPIFADEQRDVWVSVSDEIVCDYALVASGDSMLPRIRDGDLVFIREMPVVPNGRIAAVLIEDEAALKRVFFYPETQKLVLVSDNPTWEPFVYLGEELASVRILGLAVAAQTNLMK